MSKVPILFENIDQKSERSGAKKITITKIELSSKETCKRSDLARQLANESVLVEFAKGVEKNIVPCKKVISFENNAKLFCTCQNRNIATLPTWSSLSRYFCLGTFDDKHQSLVRSLIFDKDTAHCVIFD